MTERAFSKVYMHLEFSVLGKFESWKYDDSTALCGLPFVYRQVSILCCILSVYYYLCR